MKTLIILSAKPASGKSTWARKYAARHENCFIVSSDAIRTELTNDYQDHSKQKEMWEIFSKRIHEYGAIEDSTVILDALNDLNSLRVKYVKDNPEFDKYVLVLISCPNWLCRLRNKRRKKAVRVPKDIMNGLLHKFEEPDDKTLSLFDEVIKL